MNLKGQPSQPDPKEPVAVFSANDWCRNLTFAHAADRASDGDSGCSRMATIDRQQIQAERLHSKAAYPHCRPI